jgi:hypothetical protein
MYGNVSAAVVLSLITMQQRPIIYVLKIVYVVKNLNGHIIIKERNNMRKDLEHASIYIEGLIALLERDYQVSSPERQEMVAKMREVKANLDKYSYNMLVEEVVAEHLGINKGAV